MKITLASIVNDTQDAVVILNPAAGSAGVQGESMTVTVSDGTSADTVTPTLNFNIAPDSSPTHEPYIKALPANPVVTAGQSVAVGASTPYATAGSGKYFSVVSSDPNLTVSGVNNTNGAFTVTAAGTAGGVSSVLMRVANSSTDTNYDSQVVPILVTPAAPTAVTLDAANPGDGTGVIKSNSGLKFDVSGVFSGFTVTLMDGATAIGSAVATGSTVTITMNAGATLNSGANTITAVQSLTTAGLKVPNSNTILGPTSPVLTSAAASTTVTYTGLDVVGLPTSVSVDPGSSLEVGLTGAGGTNLTYTVTSSDPSMVSRR